MTKIKNVLIKGVLEGNGIVNYDDKLQNNIVKKMGLIEKEKYDNIKLAKKVFYKNDDNEVTSYKIKISQNCLRHSIYQNDVAMLNSSVMLNDVIWCTYLASFVGLTRGYLMIDNIHDNLSLKRKSCLSVTDAIQSNNTKSYVEVNTTNGEKNSTSLFYTESIGDITYDFNANINIKELQFISADELYDRLAIKSDWIENGLFLNCLKQHFGDLANPKFGHFTNQAQFLTKILCEHGILLNDELQIFLIKQLLKRMVEMRIERNGSYARFKSLKIKLVSDIIPLTKEKEEEKDDDSWLEIVTVDDIDTYFKDIEPFIFYEESTDEEIQEKVKLKEEYDKNKEEMKIKKQNGQKNKPKEIKNNKAKEKENTNENNV